MQNNLLKTKFYSSNFKYSSKSKFLFQKNIIFRSAVKEKKNKLVFNFFVILTVWQWLAWKLGEEEQSLPGKPYLIVDVTNSVERHWYCRQRSLRQGSHGTRLYKIYTNDIPWKSDFNLAVFFNDPAFVIRHTNRRNN